MKILIVEDRREEKEKARLVVEESGHMAVVVSFMKDAVSLLPTVDGVLTDMFFPPQNPLDRFGGKNVDVEEIEGIFENAGIGDDLSNKDRSYLNDPPASGLLVILSAVTLGKPVVVCTDGTPEGHHGVKLSWIFDSFVAQSRYGGLSPEVFPFGWNEKKDWADALSQLVNRAGGSTH